MSRTLFGEDDEHENKRARQRFSDEDVLSIYSAYPRKRARERSLRAIRAALVRVQRDEPDDPVGYLLGRVRAFAGSSAGKLGKFVPYCSSWMNDSEYLTCDAEWNVSDMSNPTRIQPPDGKYRHLE